MSYDKNKKAFDNTVKKIIAHTGGKLSTKEVQNRLRKAIDKQQSKNKK